MGSRKAPKPPPPTAREKAFERRSEIALSREIEEENRRKRLLLRGTLGTRSLLSGFQVAGGTPTFKGTTFAPRSGAPSTGPAASLLSPSGPGAARASAGNFGTGIGTR